MKLYSLLLENGDADKERIRYIRPESILNAINTIKGRWPEAEEFIKENKSHWDEYKSFICEECNGDGVIDLGIGGAEEEYSTWFGKGFDLSKI